MSDPSWDSEPSDPDLDSSDLEGVNIHKAARRKRGQTGLHYTPNCKYQDEDIQEKYGIDPNGRDAVRNTWKMKFVDCWKTYRDNYFPDIRDDTVVELRTAASYYLDARKSTASGPNRRTFAGHGLGSKTTLKIPTEVERFFHNNATIEMHQSPLAWWKANGKAYPVCAAMARDILAIPASAAEPERVHSQARTVMDWNQSRMGPRTIEASVMVKCSVLYNPSTAYGHLDLCQVERLYDPENTLEPSE
jgi:hypothetical protein